MKPTPFNEGPFLVLGLSGRAGAGKDTCADILCAAFSFYRMAFADAVREEIVDAFGIDPALFKRDTKERKAIALAVGRCADGEFIQLMADAGECITSARSPREIMRWWGTEYRRKQCPTYWTDRAAEKIDSAFARGYRRIVMTDVRFANEASFVRAYEGEVWRIHRNTADAQHADHRSETEVDQISPDASIDNNDTVVRLAALSVRTLLDRIDTVRKPSQAPLRTVA